MSLRGADRAVAEGLTAAGFPWKPGIALSAITGAGTAAAMAWLGATTAWLFPAASWWVAGGTGVLALARFAWRSRRPAPREPTRSIFAVALVLAMVQTADAVRLASFGLAALTGEPLLVACGMVLGQSIALAASRQVAPQ